MSEKNNLEDDLHSAKEIVEKVKSDKVYAQNLYAAMCNMTWVKDGSAADCEPWGCSWRYSGGIVADIADDGGNYLDWYCSGIMGSDGMVEEGTVSDRIKDDLGKIGWTPKPYPDEN